MQPVNYTDISFLGNGFNPFYQTTKQAWFWLIKKILYVLFLQHAGKDISLN